MRWYIDDASFVFDEFESEHRAKYIYDLLKKDNKDIRLNSCDDDAILYSYYPGAFDVSSLPSSIRNKYKGNI